MLNFLFTKAYAQGVDVSAGLSGPISGSAVPFDQLLHNINTAILSPLIYLMFVLALVYFLYGVFVFIRNADSAEKRAEGGKGILWGIIGMFIMISVKGIINLILGSMGAI